MRKYDRLEYENAHLLSLFSHLEAGLINQKRISLDRDHAKSRAQTLPGALASMASSACFARKLHIVAG